MIRVIEERTGPVYSAGHVEEVRHERVVHDGETRRSFRGCLSSSVGNVAVRGYERTDSARRRDEQTWYFWLVDPRTGLQHYRIEARSRRDFLTTLGAKRVALRWAREVMR